VTSRHTQDRQEDRCLRHRRVLPCGQNGEVVDELSHVAFAHFSVRAKALMGREAFGGFVLLALVIAHAVSLLGQ
jgi:hypothetical protein